MTDFADSPLQRKWAKLKRNKAALFGGILIIIYVTCALFAPILFTGNPVRAEPDEFAGTPLGRRSPGYG